MKLRAFTLVEVIIVVCVLGILAAIIVPQLAGSTTRAKEATTKTMLQTVRSQIELYKFDHGVAPGYQSGLQAPLLVLERQFTGTSMPTGQASANPVPTGPYIHGPYLNELQTNLFNNLSTFKYIPNATAFADAVDGTTSGWLYKKETAEFKINLTGTDSEGVNFYDY